MSAYQSFATFKAAGVPFRRPVVGMQFLHRPTAGRRTGLLANLLFGASVPAKAASPARINVALFCRTPSGKAAVEISL